MSNHIIQLHPLLQLNLKIVGLFIRERFSLFLQHFDGFFYLYFFSLQKYFGQCSKFRFFHIQALINFIHSCLLLGLKIHVFFLNKHFISFVLRRRVNECRIFIGCVTIKVFGTFIPLSMNLSSSSTMVGIGFGSRTVNPFK